MNAAARDHTAYWYRDSVVQFAVKGLPIPQGSYRAGAPRKDGKRSRVVAHNKVKLDAWREHVAQKARQVAPAPWDGRALVFLRFVLPRPKSVPKRRPQKTKPDLDKLQRSILDALDGVLWTEDSRVSHIVAHKGYGPQAGVEVCFMPLPDHAEVQYAVGLAVGDDMLVEVFGDDNGVESINGMHVNNPPPPKPKRARKKRRGATGHGGRRV